MTPDIAFVCRRPLNVPPCLQVRDVRIISDRNSRRSKGIAYIEFVESSSVPLAIGLTGQRLLGVPIIVQASQVTTLAAKCRADRRGVGALQLPNPDYPVCHMNVDPGGEK